MMTNTGRANEYNYSNNVNYQKTLHDRCLCRPAAATCTPRDWIANITMVLAVAAVAIGGSFATDTKSSWYESLDLPSFQPPSIAFPVVWTTLYVTMAISMIIVWHYTKDYDNYVEERTHDIGRFGVYSLWALNLALNLAWTLIFFQAHSPLAAGIEILLLLLTTIGIIVVSWPINRLASLMIVPYAIWVSYATALTWTIYHDNK